MNGPMLQLKSNFYSAPPRLASSKPISFSDPGIIYTIKIKPSLSRPQKLSPATEKGIASQISRR
jgi:hypothetical protein